MYACNSKGAPSLSYLQVTKVLTTNFDAVWDVEYTFLDGKVRDLTSKLSNDSITGMVSMIASEYAVELHNPLNKVWEDVNRDVKSITLEQLTKRYEIEMSKAMLISLVVNSVDVPADLVQMKRHEIVTRLPALALWLLVTGNSLFALLAITIAICAIKSASTEVH